MPLLLAKGLGFRFLGLGYRVLKGLGFSGLGFRDLDLIIVFVAVVVACWASFERVRPWCASATSVGHMHSGTLSADCQLADHKPETLILFAEQAGWIVFI